MPLDSHRTYPFQEKRTRQISEHIHSLSRRPLEILMQEERGEKERDREKEKTRDTKRRVLTISGSGRLWGQIIGLRPITRWRRRYIEESGCRRVPRIVLAAKNKIPPGSGDYVPKKEEPDETLALFVCAGGGGMRKKGRRWGEDGTMISGRGKRKNERGGDREGTRRKRVRKEGPPLVVNRALEPRLMKLSVEDVYRWGLPACGPFTATAAGLVKSCFTSQPGVCMPGGGGRKGDGRYIGIPKCVRVHLLRSYNERSRVLAQTMCAKSNFRFLSSKMVFLKAPSRTVVSTMRVILLQTWKRPNWRKWKWKMKDKCRDFFWKELKKSLLCWATRDVVKAVIYYLRPHGCVIHEALNSDPFSFLRGCV